MCDPSFPLLRDDDYAVSKALYDKQLSQHYTDLDLKVQNEKGWLSRFSSYICLIQIISFRKIIKIKKINSTNFYTFKFTSSW